MTDKTNLDINRRNLQFYDEMKVSEVLPEYFAEEFPKLIRFLEAYYEYEAITDINKISQLFASRDISQTDLDLLSFIEDELLLGQQFFKGFENKREASKYSNTLYRSKGSLFSIQQFFKMFFGINPDVIYTKKNVFIIDESLIGADSLRYITDDKLYQTFALLIKSEIPINEWRPVYKLSAHPAGMYVGGELQLVSVFMNPTVYQPTSMPIVEYAIPVDSISDMFATGYLDISGIISDEMGGYVRTDLESIDEVQFYTPINLAGYKSIEQFIQITSITTDQDGITSANTIENMSDGNYNYNDSA